jgi:hypothetical protein
MERVGLSFQEKSLWVQLSGLVVVFGVYFAMVARSMAPGEVDVTPAQMGLFAAAVVVLVLSQIAGQTLLAIAQVVARRRGDTEADERDRLIALKGARNASYVLATGVFFTLGAAVAVEGNFVFTHLLLAFWVIAQLTGIGSQLVLYRRGA